MCNHDFYDVEIDNVWHRRCIECGLLEIKPADDGEIFGLRLVVNNFDVTSSLLDFVNDAEDTKLVSWTPGENDDRIVIEITRPGGKRTTFDEINITFGIRNDAYEWMEPRNDAELS